MLLAIVLVAAVLPAFILLYFIYRKDKIRPEPPKQILLAFLMGMLSVPASLLISLPMIALGVAPEQAVTVGEHLRTALFGAAIPEELAKFFLLWMFLRKNRYFDERVDGIVYAACVGLGFAAVENIEYLLLDFDSWVLTGALRALSAVPAHFLFAVAMGYYFSGARFGDPARSRRNYVLAVLAPILLHGLYDFPVMVADLPGLAIVSFLSVGVLVFMFVRGRKYFKAHQAVDARTAAMDEAIRTELEDAADGKRDNPVGDVIHLPERLGEDSAI